MQWNISTTYFEPSAKFIVNAIYPPPLVIPLWLIWNMSDCEISSSSPNNVRCTRTNISATFIRIILKVEIWKKTDCLSNIFKNKFTAEATLIMIECYREIETKIVHETNSLQIVKVNKLQVKITLLQQLLQECPGLIFCKKKMINMDQRLSPQETILKTRQRTWGVHYKS